MMRFARCLITLAALVGVLGPQSAFAHGEYTSSTPEKGAKLDAVPSEVVVSFSEAPVDANTFVVKDGCGRDVVNTATVEGRKILATTSAGQPGAWLAEWDIVSAEDGHPSSGSLSFRVTGQPDCSKDTGGGQGRAAPEGGGGSGTILLILAGATVVLVVLAVAFRGKSQT
jgi:methionine-rich copper-binding protein CopC